MTEDAVTCPACGSTTPADARFCPSCGARLDGEETTVAYSAPERRLFGVVPPIAALTLAGVFLLAAVVGLATANWILGVSLLVLAAVMFVVFDEAARRAPETPITRTVLGVEDRARDLLRLTGESTRAWAGAGTGVVRLRQEVRALRQERKKRVLALGEASFREERDEVAALRAQIAEIDERIATAEREEAETLERARGRVAEEKLAAQPTHVLRPDADGDVGAPQEQGADVESRNG